MQSCLVLILGPVWSLVGRVKKTGPTFNSAAYGTTAVYATLLGLQGMRDCGRRNRVLSCIIRAHRRLINWPTNGRTRSPSGPQRRPGRRTQRSPDDRGLAEWTRRNLWNVGDGLEAVHGEAAASYRRRRVTAESVSPAWIYLVLSVIQHRSLPPSLHINTALHRRRFTTFVRIKRLQP